MSAYRKAKDYTGTEDSSDSEASAGDMTKGHLGDAKHHPQQQRTQPDKATAENPGQRDP